MMSELEPFEDIAFRRILVALDTSSHGIAALDAAAMLAAELRSELQGLFIEDESLFRLAGLPFAEEILYSSAVRRQFDLANIERTLRARAEELRRQFAERAEQSQIKWSFEVARGRMVQRALTAAADADLLLIARETSIPPALTIARRLADRRPILVVYDETPAGRRALITAARLVRATRSRMVVLIAAKDADAVDQLEGACARWLEDRGIAAVLERCCVTTGEQLVEMARRHDAKLLLLSRDSGLVSGATMEKLVDVANCPVGLVS